MIDTLQEHAREDRDIDDGNRAYLMIQAGSETYESCAARNRAVTAIAIVSDLNKANYNWCDWLKGQEWGRVLVEAQSFGGRQ